MVQKNGRKCPAACSYTINTAMIKKEITQCRVCESHNLIPYLDLGMMPLSNNLATSAEDPIHSKKYPLKVLFCKDCGLSQLSLVIDPRELFSHYVYRSSISQGYINHCHSMAVDFKERFGLNENSFHIDIAGNDGALLKEFKAVTGSRVLNIDPAENLAEISEASGVPILTEFWSVQLAEWLVIHSVEKADLITATNVFAHVDDVKEFIQAAKIMLKPEGKLVLEFPYLVDFLENNEFDTIYFEHLSYFSIYPLALLCRKAGLEVLRVEKQNIHGGTVRVTIGNGIPDKTVLDFMLSENEFLTEKPYLEFAKNVQHTIHSFRNGIYDLKGKVAAFAASAKGNTLLNSAKITAKNIQYIVDETPEKIGKYSPGTFIPICAMDELKRNPPDYLVILSWNFKEEIINKCRAAGYAGKFVIPIPEFTIVDTL